MRRKSPIALAAAAALVLAGCGGGGGEGEQSNAAAAAGPGPGDVPSCYAAVGLDVPAPAPRRALFVLVDQTTGLDERLRETVRSNVERLLEPGTAFTIATFSAFSRGNYATVASSGAVEAPLTEEQRLNLPAPRVAEMAGCLEQQRAFAADLVGRKTAEATDAASTSFDSSEIMASLRQLAEAVRESRADQEMVIVVSDLLEHSSAASFYRSRDLRQLDPAEELRNAERNDLFADFGGARVAVIGAGLLSPESGAEARRETAKLNALRNFWTTWFERSNAQVVAYGQPDLVSPLRWSS